MTFKESLLFSLAIVGFATLVAAGLLAFIMIADWFFTEFSLWVSLPAMLVVVVAITTVAGMMLTKEH